MDKLIGNEVVQEILEDKILTSSLPDKILLTGTVGTGKSTLAMNIAKELNSEIVVLNMAEKSKITEYINSIFNYQRKTTFILEELQGVTGADQDRLIEYLNQMDSENVTLIATTSEPYKIKSAIKSRFVTFEMRPLNLKETEELISSIAINYNDSLSKIIYRYTRGIPRDIIKIVKMDIDEEKLKRFINYVENDEIIDFFNSMDSFASFIGFIRSKDLSKNFISTLKEFTMDAVAYLNGVKGSDNVLNKVEKGFATKKLSNIDQIKLLEVIDGVKENDSYSFIPVYKLFGNKVPTPKKELEQSKVFEDLNNQETDFISENELVNLLGGDVIK